MANKVKLTEADLNRIVKKVLNEAPRLNRSLVNRIADGGSGQQQQQGGAGGWAGAAARSIAATNNPKVKALAAYLKQNNITPQELTVAQKLNATGGVSPTPAKPTSAPGKPKPQQQQGGVLSNAVNSAKQGIQKTINTGLGYAAKGLKAATTGTTPAKPQA